MTEQTRCPACGAPLSAVGEQDLIVCDFCNTQIRVLHEGDEERLEVVPQPGAQKEALSQEVEPAVEDVLFGERVPAEEPRLVTEELSPAVPYDVSGSNENLFAPPPPVSSTPFDSATGGAQVFTPNSPSATGKKGLGGLPRWAIIVIIVVAVLCLACACVGGAIALLTNAGSITY